MIIIGHRGAAGIEAENTVPSIKAAARARVDMIEFDVRVTKDNRLVVFHDPNLIRIAGVSKNLSDLTLDEVQKVTTRSGHPIPTLQEALKTAGDIPVLIDCKGGGWAEALDKELKIFQGPIPAITAINTDEMFRFRQLRPDMKTYMSELTNPFEAAHKAHTLGFSGVSINFWVMNPLVYFYIKRRKLETIIFTVNYPLLARFVHLLYPSAAIITNVPQRLAPLAKRRRKET